MIGNWVYVFAALLGLLQVADYVTTRKILFLGGKEINPVMKWIFGNLGEKLSMVVTKLVATGIGFGLAYMSKGVVGPELFGLWVLIALYVGIFVNNTAVLKDMDL